jgi:lipopolysaccharide export system protein LptC
MPRKTLFSIIILLLVAGGTWLLMDHLEPEEKKSFTVSHTPDYFLDGFVTTTMNIDGKPKQRIRGDRMIHYIDDDSTEITQPIMTIYNGEAPPWVVVSEAGWLSADGDLLMLLGEVQMDRAGSDTTKPTHIDTNDLRVQPKDDYAETDQNIFITSIDDKMKGIGMRFFFSEPVRFELLSEVRGYYVPTQK